MNVSRQAVRRHRLQTSLRRLVVAAAALALAIGCLVTWTGIGTIGDFSTEVLGTLIAVLLATVVAALRCSRGLRRLETRSGPES